MPLQNGLYAAAAGAIIYALFCTSRQISTGTELVAGRRGGRRGARSPGSADRQAAQLVAAITLATGLLFLLLALFRLGWIAQFLSKAVITGFLAGRRRRRRDRRAAQAHRDRLRTATTRGGSSASWIGSLGDVHGTTVLVGGSSLGVILGLRFLAPAVPGALVLVAGGILASYVFDLGAHGVALVGDVPRGLPAPELPDLDAGRATTSRRSAIAAVALLLIGFSQTAGDARAFAARHDYRHRRRPGVGGAGHGERRRGRVPGDAGLDQPLGQLAERVGRGADAGRVADHRRRSCC